MKAKTRKPRPLICKVIRCRFTCQEYAQMIEHLTEEHGLVIRDGIVNEHHYTQRKLSRPSKLRRSAG